MRRVKPSVSRRYTPYTKMKLREDPQYIEKIIPSVLNWDEVRKREENKERRNEEKFRNAFYKSRKRGAFNTEEFVSAFKHAEARGSINVNNFVRHFFRRRTLKPRPNVSKRNISL